MKPWKIVASFPTLHSKEFGCYSSRSCAEQDALRFQRCLGRSVAVYVVWSPEDGAFTTH